MPKSLIPFAQSPHQNRTDLGSLGATGQRVLRYSNFKMFKYLINILVLIIKLKNKRISRWYKKTK